MSDSEVTNNDKNKQIVDVYKQHYLKRYNIEGVDLEKEFALIQKKESNLSRSQRDAVVAAMQIFPMMEKKAEEQTNLDNQEIGAPLTKEEADAVIAEANKETEEENKE